MRCLIVGGAGFIGSHAVDHFVACGDEVAVIDKMTYAGSIYNISDTAWKQVRDRFFVMDICDADQVDKVFSLFKPDVVLNFAAETHVDNSIADQMPFVKTNFEGVATLATAARKHSVFFCQVSTDEVYGSADSCDEPCNNKPLRPMNPYAASKAAADMLVQANYNTYKQDYLIFRMSNNFGPRQHNEKFLPKLVKCLTSGDIFPLFGDGNQIREWTYAPDAVKSMRVSVQAALADKLMRNWVTHITADNHRTNLEMIEAVKASLTRLKISWTDTVQHSEDRPGHDRRYWLQDESSGEFTRFEDALDTTVAALAEAARKQ